MLRRYKFLVVLLFSFFNIYLTQGQSISGKVVDSETRQAIVGVIVSLEGTDVETVTNARGSYRLLNIPSGDYTLVVNGDGIKETKRPFSYKGDDLRLEPIAVLKDLLVIDITEIAVIELNDEEVQSDEGDGEGQEYSSLLTANRDVFTNNAAYTLSAGRFRPRGYNNEEREAYLNGFAINDLDDGRIFFGAFGGLNDVLRSVDEEFTLQPTSFAFGGIGGAATIDTRASVQRRQTKVVYNFGNRTYTNRLMATYSTGEMQNGWSLSLSGSRRWGNKGYIEGTFYDAWAYFLSVEKKFNDAHSLNLTVLGAPSKRGRSGGSVQEMYDLTGNVYYNPYWGYQNGKVRNARAYTQHQPITILRHDWKISDKINLTTSGGYQFGYLGTTGLNWFEAPDPRPDYYKKLPSFQENPQLAQSVANYISNNPEVQQIQWDELYRINYQSMATIEDVNGVIGATRTGRQAAYYVQDQRFDNEKLNFNSILQAQVNENFNISAGAAYLNEKVHNYRLVNDLLGAEFVIDYDNFALRDFPGNDDSKQSDLDNPNRVVEEGDRFGYNYDIVTTRYRTWGQGTYTMNKLDLFAGIDLSRTSFYREGFYRNGLFPASSKGKSEVQNFNNYGVKLGATYKIDGRNYLYASGTVRTRSPYSRFAYLSARTRDQLVDSLHNEDIFGLETGYILRYPGLKGRISGYYTEFRNQIDNTSFYNDELRSFVNYVLDGVNKRHMGVELGLEYAITSTLNIEAVAAVGEYIFTSRPTATVTQDNNSEALITDRTVYINNFYVPGTPQQAFTLGLDYRSPNYWFATFNANYFRKIYLDFNPDRRTAEAVEGILRPELNDLYYEIINQQELDPHFTLDFFGGKSWKIDDYFLNLIVSVSNILDNQEFITGGFEQYRFDYEGQDVDRFPPKYFYAFGRNFSIGLTLRM